MQPVDRYSKQIRYAPFGEAGQQRLLQARVLLVGIGALGSHIASSLVRAGVGQLRLVDRDIVEIENLHRQVLYDEADAAAGRPKAIAAAQRLAKINSGCELIAMVEDFDRWSLRELGDAPDLILDGTDNFATRYLLNDYALSEGIPWIYGGAVGSVGRAMAILPGETPCLRCILPSAPPGGEIGNCETEGIIEPVIAQVAAFQTSQALKILSGNQSQVARGMFRVDVWKDDYGIQLRDLEPRADCVSCGLREFPALSETPVQSTGLCGRDAVQIKPADGTEVNLRMLASKLENAVEDLDLGEHVLRFRAESCRFHVFPGGRTLVLGTSDENRARSLYDRYVGS